MDTIKIPQNIRVEDKLIGPFSLPKLIISGIGVGISYALFAMVKKAYGSVPVGANVVVWIPAVLALAFALVRINDISLFRYLLLLIERMLKPQRRFWQPRVGVYLTQASGSSKKESDDKKEKGKKGEKNSVEKQESPVRLKELSMILDDQGRKRAKPPEKVGSLSSRKIDTVYEDESDFDIGLSEKESFELKAHAQRIDALMNSSHHPIASPAQFGADVDTIRSSS